MPPGGSAIRVLNVAEKPSVAKSVAEILSRGGMQSRAGRSRYNRVFEFNYAIGAQACHMLVTSVTGHLMELDFDDRYRRWYSCDPAELFHAPVRKAVPQDKQDIKRTLEEEARTCQWLVLWLDCDREGENIAYEVVDICAGANRNLNIWRARFSALIPREIHEAVQHLARPNKLFADAVDARQEIDLRIGASFTRFQTMLLKDAFVLDVSGEERNMVLSYGPCQFPTLGFIVERFWEIQAHEPEEFWTINCSHTSDEGTASFIWIRGHLFDYSSAVVIYEMCVHEPMATVQNVRNQEKLKYPPYPLSTVELQKRASRCCRMSSEHTMKVAEELYQAGFISYPRTETDSFSPNTDLHAIVREQVDHPDWGTYAQRLLNPEERLWRNPSNGGHDDKAHPPIHPTKFSTGENNWSPDHKKVYELVVRHFLACCSQPAVGAETTVEVDIAGEQFNASGRVVLAKNYLDVYRYDSWGGSLLPTYTIGQQFVPTSLTLDSGVTRPPPLLAEADLLSCMDKAGIGTDATMHEHIKKLLDRCYATKDANSRFSPTNLGEALVMGYDEMGYELWKPYLRAMMEADMKSVSVGTKSKAQVLEGCLQQMKACFLDARANKVKLLDAMGTFFARSNRPINETQNTIEVVRPCGACNDSEMLLKRRPNGGFMVGCRGFPQCRNVVWLPGSLAEAAVTQQICPTCVPGPVYKIQFKFNRRDIPPSFDVDHLGCIGGCDDVLKELTEMSRFQHHNQTTTPARSQSQTQTTSTSGVRQGAPRQDLPTGSRSTGQFANQHTPAVNPQGRGQSQTPSAVGVRQGTPRQDLHTVFRTASQFANEQQTPGVNPQGFRSTHTGLTQNSRNASSSGAGQVLCTTCGEACINRTANTEANRGRKFYKCQNPGCGFFVWEDELDNVAPRGRGRGSRGGGRQASASAGRRGGGRGRRGRGNTDADGMTFISATGDTVHGCCFTCGDPSHFANACPNRGR
ncbi:DNA topoisomerase 3-alpha [Aegilops tauschii subsp. strangulata]|nr:DNA topoisomerase 3-alpha [Aegilops tauschii subsp. strangulata]XP_044376490.1 DNA topoisomerase 3-alpha-like [Triticum aestivum]